MCSWSIRSGKPFFGLKKEQLLQFLIQEAQRRLQTEVLRRWWCKKYNAPPTDPRYQAYTIEELILEYLEDAIEDGRISPEIDEKGRIVSDPVLKALEEQFELEEKFEDVYNTSRKDEDVE